MKHITVQYRELSEFLNEGETILLKMHEEDTVVDKFTRTGHGGDVQTFFGLGSIAARASFDEWSVFYILCRDDRMHLSPLDGSSIVTFILRQCLP